MDGPANAGRRHGHTVNGWLGPRPARPPSPRKWYLNRDGSLGVTPDGGYYVLVTSPSLLARVRGVRLQPVDPPLQVGAGARDGESIALNALLTLRLDAGNAWAMHGL